MLVYLILATGNECPFFYVLDFFSALTVSKPNTGIGTMVHPRQFTKHGDIFYFGSFSLSSEWYHTLIVHCTLIRCNSENFLLFMIVRCCCWCCCYFSVILFVFFSVRCLSIRRSVLHIQKHTVRWWWLSCCYYS